MNIIKNPFFRRRLILLLVTILLSLWLAWAMQKNKVDEDRFAADVVGVHHLGPDHIVNNFYINKSIRDSVGEGGGGGSRRCCVNLPGESSPQLMADVRWEVWRVVRSADPTALEAAEVEGVYQAHVPVEPYVEPGDFYVHFFPKGRVRIVVSRYTAAGDRHPIQYDDMAADHMATSGRPIKAIFSEQELDELQRKIDRNRKLYGDWR